MIEAIKAINDEIKKIRHEIDTVAHSAARRVELECQIKGLRKALIIACDKKRQANNLIGGNMDITEVMKGTRISCNETFLTLLSGLRKTVFTPEDKAYNNALADAFDYIIETQKSCLLEHTVRCGKWVRD